MRQRDSRIAELLSDACTEIAESDRAGHLDNDNVINVINNLDLDGAQSRRGRRTRCDARSTGALAVTAAV